MFSSLKKNKYRTENRLFGFICIVIIILAVNPSVSSAEWRLGCDAGFFSNVGNLSLRKSVLEYEVFVNHENRGGGIYWLSATYQKPALEKTPMLSRFDMAAVWFMRSARFSFLTQTFQISAGPGISIIDRENNRGRTIFGSFSFRSDFQIFILERHGISTSLGCTYRGCPLHNTGLITDRFGLMIVVSG